MPDPIGSEFGIVADEITYGADLETGMRNLYFRIGQEDLPLFVTAVAIQSSTGGNSSEILQNLSAVIRQRFKMRRKIRALAAEGRASALILSSLPIMLFLIIKVVAPEFYASVWHEDLTKIVAGLRGRAGWGSATSSCTAWSTSRSDRWTCLAPAIQTMVARAGLPGGDDVRVLRDGAGARAGLGQAPRRRHRQAGRRATHGDGRARCGIRASRPRSG